MAIITLTTDFGETDTYAGVMKGVILGIAPDASIVDLTHGITSQDIVGAALALESALDYFPDGTIHVAVVDPGVGSDRKAIAIQTENFFLVGPDNGLFSLALDRHPHLQAIHLTNSQFHLKSVSATFHGRDIFAPVAAQIARGAPLLDLGAPIEDLTKLVIPKP